MSATRATHGFLAAEVPGRAPDRERENAGTDGVDPGADLGEGLHEGGERPENLATVVRRPSTSGSRSATTAPSTGALRGGNPTGGGRQPQLAAHRPGRRSPSVGDDRDPAGLEAASPPVEPVPPPVDHAEADVGRLGPTGPVAEHDQDGPPLPGPGGQRADDRRPGTAGWSHDDDVETVEQSASGHGPLGGRGLDDGQPVEVDAIAGRGEGADVVDADEPAPRAGGRRRADRGQGKAEGPSPVAADDAAPAQPTVGQERGQRVGHR